MPIKSSAALAAVVVFTGATSSGAMAAEAECDGRQMYNYVDVALKAGGGVVNVANDPAYGGGSVSLALRSQNMQIYSQMISDIREHDLSVARSGCKTLTNGPTKGMLSTLRQVESKIQALVSSQYREKGVLTDGFGDIR